MYLTVIIQKFVSYSNCFDWLINLLYRSSFCSKWIRRLEFLIRKSVLDEQGYRLWIYIITYTVRNNTILTLRRCMHNLAHTETKPVADNISTQYDRLSYVSYVICSTQQRQPVASNYYITNQFYWYSSNMFEHLNVLSDMCVDHYKLFDEGITFSINRQHIC